ncbi:hypothetical protein E2C01_072715 [Portunus trituberculatus]|uniref:Uncharacterized protein n=1 Tax=Portunus trituberculatus TaxID=210409 RepID=A0A5B7HYS3_PORTR|nr:hypothetical protein [Portunus trituberculatus]
MKLTCGGSAHIGYILMGIGNNPAAARPGSAGVSGGPRRGRSRTETLPGGALPTVTSVIPLPPVHMAQCSSSFYIFILLVCIVVCLYSAAGTITAFVGISESVSFSFHSSIFVPHSALRSYGKIENSSSNES